MGQKKLAIQWPSRVLQQVIPVKVCRMDAIVIDFSKAFDVTSRGQMIKKLDGIGLDRIKNSGT